MSIAIAGLSAAARRASARSMAASGLLFVLFASAVAVSAR